MGFLDLRKIELLSDYYLPEGYRKMTGCATVKALAWLLCTSNHGATHNVIRSIKKRTLPKRERPSKKSSNEPLLLFQDLSGFAVVLSVFLGQLDGCCGGLLGHLFVAGLIVEPREGVHIRVARLHLNGLLGQGQGLDRKSVV